MIQETQRKIHFTPFELKRGREKDTSPVPTLTLNTETGGLVFSKSLMTELSLEGKFVKFFYEPVKRIIGFQIRHVVTDGELKTWKLVKSSGNTGIWKVSIGRLLHQFNSVPTKKLYSLMPVKKYIEKDAIFGKGEVYYYVQLIDDPDFLLRQGLGNEDIGDSHTE